MHIEHELIECDCRNHNCPVFSKCCFLPTECHPDKKGNISILFVGQGGGSDERKRKRPFIGRAGKRLREQILYMRKDLKRHVGVAFSNTIRDNPEDNRIPTEEELKFCLEFLYRDIAALKKRGLGVVIPLGNAAKSALIEGSGAMSKAHGTLFTLKNEYFGEISVIPTYHPSYIIRNVPKFNPDKISKLDDIVLTDFFKAYLLSETKKVDKILDIEEEIIIPEL